MVVRETRPPNVIRTPLGTGDITISSPGIYRLSGATNSITITSPDVDILGNRHTLQKLDNDQENCKLDRINFGDFTGTTDAGLPTTRKSTGLTTFLCRSKTPITVTNCNFSGTDENGTVCGLLLGDNASTYQSASFETVKLSHRLVENCTFQRLGVGVFVLPKMEYYKFSDNFAGHCSNGFVIHGGNTQMTGTSAIWCYEGLYLSYPRTGGLAYSWSGDLTSPTTYSTGALANAYKNRIDGIILNHCFYGLHVRETLNGSDPNLYEVKMTGVQMQANNYGVFNSGYENLNISSGLVYGSTNAFWNTGEIFLYGVRQVGGPRSGSVDIHFGHQVGTGTPESNVYGNIGDTYSRTDGGASTSYYVKESGNTTTTGWVAK